MITTAPTPVPRLDLTPPPPPLHHEPLRLADDVFAIRQVEGEGTQPVCLAINSLVIAGKEPVLIDTGSHNNRARWLEDAFSIVAPDSVRWIYISHDDIDHVGNLEPALQRCPNATLVASFLITQRMSGEVRLPLTRMRWVNDGDHFDVGDRSLVALRPPTFDSPATRGLFDTKSRIYWATDAFGALLPYHVDRAGDVPQQMYEMGFTAFNRTMAPWVALADQRKFSDSVDAIRALDASCIASCHGPVIEAKQLSAALTAMEALPSTAPMPIPDQSVLDAMLEAATHGTTDAGH